MSIENPMNNTKNRPPLLFRFVVGVLLVFLTAMAVFYIVMQPEAVDVRLMALLLGVTSLFTLMVGYLANRFGWLSQVPSLRWALFGTYALASLLAFVNVWLAARLMFASEHDLLLGTILLIFAGGITMILGYFFSETLTSRITALRNTVREIRSGSLDSRAPVMGRDEITELASTFNSMLEQLETAIEKQRELDKMRRDLITWVGHDLQTPLASIRAIVEALADGVVEDPQTRQRYLRTAKRDIQALSHLIDDLFELSQLDAGGITLELQHNSLSDLISDTLESFTALSAESGVTLSGEVEKDVDPIIMDAKRIGRVLDNLIGNAIRYTPSGGKVAIIAQPVQGAVEVQIRDTGEGFNPADLPFLFDRFYRGEKSRSRDTGGVGLGLAIAKGFIEAHGGQIEAQLIPEGGSMFKFTLPNR
jgi:signal transduction histidine kinase